MTSYQRNKKIKVAEACKNCLIHIDMTSSSPTAYDHSALLLHALYPQLSLQYAPCEDGKTHPVLTDIPQKIILEVCRRYRLVEATARIIANSGSIRL